MRKILSHAVDKSIVTLSKGIMVIADINMVEFGIHLLPWKRHKVVLLKQLMQWLTLLKPTNIMKTCVEFSTCTTKSLQAPTRLRLFFEHQHFIALFCKSICTLQTA